jgi:hypothetical protein
VNPFPNDPPPIKMAGMPSPAAAATMGPSTLPLRASDGVTLPRTTDQRDDYPAESYYGDDTAQAPASDTPMPPAATPGQAAQQAEQMRDEQSLAQHDPNYDPTYAPGGMI